MLDGGDGTDTADYTGTSGDVLVDLAQGLATGAAGLDTLTSIEVVIGGAGNDTFIGGTGNDVFYGGAGSDVLVVTEPYITDKHVAQQKSLKAMIQVRFPNQPHLRYLNIGRTVDLRDKSLCCDGIHLTEEGNRRIAIALRQPVFDLLQD